MAARYRPLIQSESTGARPVLRTGRRALFRRARLRPARLHEARCAVFALRVTIPGACAPFGRCALRLQVRAARPVHHHRRGSVAALPSPAALPNVLPTRIAALRRLGFRHGLATGSALTRHRPCSLSLQTSSTSGIGDGSSLFERYRPFAPGASRLRAQRESPPGSVPGGPQCQRTSRSIPAMGPHPVRSPAVLALEYPPCAESLLRKPYNGEKSLSHLCTKVRIAELYSPLYRPSSCDRPGRSG